MARFRFVQWKEEYSVGVDWLDDQHRQMLAIINVLNEDLQDGCAEETIAQIAEEVRIYTRRHFESEERYLEEHDYPGLAEHRDAHRKMLAWTDQLLRPLPEGNYDSGRNALNYLMHWWVNHIRKSDMEFARHIRRAELAQIS